MTEGHMYILYADSKTDDYLKDKAVAEVQVRLERGVIFDVPKCEINRLPDGCNKETLETAMQLSINEKVDLNALRKVKKNVSQMTKEIKDLSSQVGPFCYKSELASKLGFLSVGLSVVSLVVSVVGVSVVRNELQAFKNTVNTRLDHIEKDIIDLKKFNRNELVEQIDNITMDFNDITAKLLDGYKSSLEEQYSFMKETKAFCSKLINNIRDQSFDTGFLLETLFSILPSYSFVFQNCIYDSYMQTKKLPPNYEAYLSLFNQFFDEKFEATLNDYLFIDQNLSVIEISNVLCALNGIVLNYATAVMDRAELVVLLKTEEAYKEFENNLDLAVKERLEKEADEVAVMLGKKQDECRKTLQIAYSHFREGKLSHT